MKHIFPEINFDRLKAEVFRWSSWYPCIRQIDFYQHRGGEHYADKRYLIDIVVQDDTPQNEIADIEIETQDIDGSTFFQSLMNAQTGKGFNRENWELFVRQQSDDPPVFLAGDRWSLYDRYLPKMKFYPFQELNIHVLQAIAAKWVKDYTRTGAVVQSITIHPMGMPIPLAENLPDRQNRPKYAVIFHCPNCMREDLPSATDSAEEHLWKVIKKEFSPYTDLFLDLQNKSKHLFYNGNFKLYQGAEPYDWLSEWRFEMKYQDKGMSALGADIDQECGVVLFPAVEVAQAADLMSYPLPEENNRSDNNMIQSHMNDEQSWTFQCIGAQWQITFEGQTYSIKNLKHIRYMLPLIKQPRKPFGCVELCQIIGGANIDYQTDYEDGLEIQTSIEKHSEEDKKEMIKMLKSAHRQYLDHPDQNRDTWAKAKKYLEIEYGLCTNDSGKELSFSELKRHKKNDNPILKKAINVVSMNKSRFLSAIKELPSSECLYQHFKQSLLLGDGFVEYSPPDGSPHWKIIE